MDQHTFDTLRRLVLVRTAASRPAGQANFCGYIYITAILWPEKEPR
jgi:hypothetical protein